MLDRQTNNRLQSQLFIYN